VSVNGATPSRGFEPELVSVPEARRFVMDALDGWGDDDARDAVMLLVSEVVTNAVQHGRTDFEVAVRMQPHEVTVEVADHNPRMPQPCLAPPDAPSGKGLLVVDATAASWGSERHHDGKVVWFSVTPDGNGVPG